MKEIGIAIKKFFTGADMLLLTLCLICSVFSIVVLSSVTGDLNDGPGRYIMIQSVATVLGVLLFMFISVINMEWLADRWIFLLLFGIAFVMLLIPYGVSDNTGNRSWLYLPGFPTGIQPAEIVKITFIIVMAKHMYAMREHISTVFAVFTLVVHFGLMMLIIRYTSQDDGMVLVYCFIFLFMCIASGLKMRWFLAAGVLLSVSLPLIWKYFLSNFQRNRILVILNPGMDPEGVEWHVNKSKIALGAGKLTGQGLGQGQQTQYGSFPAKHTDFIFSMIGEELGFIGCVAVMLMLTAIIIRCLYIASRASSGLGSLICIGVAGMTIFQTFENISMCMGLMPVVGLTLPFISYGGSSTLAMYAAMGLVSSVRLHPMPEWQRRQQLVRSKGN